MKIEPKKFKAPFIRKEEAWRMADQTREKYWPTANLPIDVEIVLWPIGLNLIPYPSLKEAGDVDALLLGDLKTIIVDSQDYMNDKKQNRIRFSITH